MKSPCAGPRPAVSAGFLSEKCEFDMSNWLRLSDSLSDFDAVDLGGRDDR